MKKFYSFFLALAFTLPLFAQLNISLETFADGFNRLTDITNCGDDRLFVVERNGRIRIIEADGNVLSDPFLNINPIVNSGASEQGLLGLAFHPDYLNNGYFYVYYTDNSEDTQVSRFSVSDDDPNIADPDSEEKILDANQPFWNHNGGCIKFGPDGYLYISLGDGGSGGDPQGNGQNRQTFLGKILRIDVDNGDPYAVPADNPFINDDETLDEIWSIGQRNVWRFSFDALTGDMWMGDVGQGDWEEINLEPANSGGGNYGWRCYEGNDNFNTFNCDPANTMIFPILQYANSFSEGCSVTGGFVYRGCEMSGLYGHYVFADFCSGKFWSITPDGTQWNTVQIANLNDNNFSSFGEDMNGELYVVGHGNGVVSKITTDVEAASAQNVSCEGMNDGAITFNIPLDQMVDITWEDGSVDTNRMDLTPGTYVVEMTTVNDCEFILELEVEEGTPYPDIPTVTIESDNTLSSDATGVSHQWYLNGAAIPGATDDTYFPTEVGNYSVVVSDNGCETTSNVVNVTVLTTLEDLGIEQLTLSPNPFGNDLHLQLSTNGLVEMEMTLSDAFGKIIQQESLPINGFFEKTYNLQNMPSGIYFFTVKNEKGEWSKQVVRQ